MVKTVCSTVPKLYHLVEEADSAAGGWTAHVLLSFKGLHRGYPKGYLLLGVNDAEPSVNLDVAECPLRLIRNATLHIYSIACLPL